VPADAIRIGVLPARMGDCILVECLRRRGDPWRLLVEEDRLTPGRSCGNG
jgi:hypothetical protein